MPSPIKAGDVFEMVQALMNDLGGDVYNSTTIPAYLKIAYEDLRQECEDNNIPISNFTSEVINIPAGVKSIGGGGLAPALPDDLIEVIELYERTGGTSNDFALMSPRRFLPKTQVLTQYLEVYTWQRQAIHFIGADGDIEVKIDYVGNPFGNIINENTVIGMFNAKNFLGFRTAALCSEFIGENKERADSLNSNASRALDTLENLGIKNQQSMPVRRRPFMSRYRTTGFAGRR